VDGLGIAGVVLAVVSILYTAWAKRSSDREAARQRQILNALTIASEIASDGKVRHVRDKQGNAIAPEVTGVIALVPEPATISFGPPATLGPPQVLPSPASRPWWAFWR
jgi:hypothetical protein